MTQTVLLGDICDVRDGTHDSPKPKDSGHPLVTSKHIKNHKIDFSTANLISDEDFEAVNKRSKVDQHDILISMIGTVGELALIDYEPTFAIKNIGLIKTGDELLGKYLFYYLQSTKAKQYIEASLAGSTQKFIGLGQLRKFPVELPDIETQKKIADILGTIDEKIELNRQMNETLEQMGQALFRHYFIDNPEAEKWETVNVSNLIDFIGGSQPPKSEHIYEPREGYVRFVQNRDYSSDGHKTYIPVAKRNKLCTVTDIMMDKYGEAGRVRFGIEGAYNVALAKIIPKYGDMQEYLRSYFSMPQIQRSLEGAAAASTRSSLNATTFVGLKIQLPPNDLLRQYEASQKDVIYGIMENAQQIQTLTTLRDTLLPRLIIGKV